MLSKLAIAKTAVRIVTVAGSSKVVHDIIQNNVSPAESKPDKVKLLVGAFVIGSMITERISEFTDNKFDDIVEMVTKTEEVEDTL